jgi:hypothetical protein
MPLSLENSLYENMQINVFESGIDSRFQTKKSSNIIENGDIEVKNIKNTLFAHRPAASRFESQKRYNCFINWT